MTKNNNKKQQNKKEAIKRDDLKKSNLYYVLYHKMRTYYIDFL